MLLLQFVRQRSAFIEVWRQFDRAPQRICDRRFARATFLSVARHHPQLLRDYFRQGCVAGLGFLLRELEKFGIKTDSQCRAHGGKLTWIRPDDKLGE
jgi:hypothetical protein